MFISLVADDLNKVRHVIVDCVKSTNNSVLLDAIITHINVTQGKLLRPSLLLIFAKIFNANQQDSIILAATIELIHIASLLHDDVLDKANTRRYNQTINYKYGNQVAILAGNFVYTKALQLIQKVTEKNKLKAFSIVNNAVSLMLEGEILQLSEKNNVAITEECYLKIITYKTAKLFSAAVELSSIIADEYNYNINYLLDFGLNLGIYYQLINDIEDYYKSGNDIADGRITLPLIFVLSKNNINLNNKIKNYINLKYQLHQIRKIIYNNGGFEYARTLAKEYINNAKNNFNMLIKDLKLNNNECQQVIFKILNELQTV